MSLIDELSKNLEADFEREIGKKPYAAMLPPELMTVRLLTDGTIHGTKVTDREGRIIPVSSISFEADFNGRDGRGLNMMKLGLVGLASIGPIEASMRYMIFRGCPNDECRYHNTGQVEQGQIKEDAKLPEDLQLLALKLRGMVAALHQAQLALWEETWRREDSEHGPWADTTPLWVARERVYKALQLAAELYPDMLTWNPEPENDSAVLNDPTPPDIQV